MSRHATVHSAPVSNTRQAIGGAILGCAVGDAIGLPYEGLSRRRGVRLLGSPTRHRLLLGRGMVSDDTEHTCLVAQALCEQPADSRAFARVLARRLRWWLLGVPAGIGLATLRATVKLWLGCSPEHSGVFSAGNGPAMRSAVLGAAIDDLPTLRQFVRASTVLTHTDPKAYHGAFAVALAAWCAKRGIQDAAGFLDQYHGAADGDPSDEFPAVLAQMEQSLAANQQTEEFARQLGCDRGVTGYVLRTVPVALHCWLRHPRDYRQAVEEVVACGGDTDTTAAIVGAIVGTGIGSSGIPPQWLHGLWEWPRSVAWMEQLAAAASEAVATGCSVRGPRVAPGVAVTRNAVFLAVVLGHGFRRLLPPY